MLTFLYLVQVSKLPIKYKIKKKLFKCKSVIESYNSLSGLHLGRRRGLLSLDNTGKCHGQTGASRKGFKEVKTLTAQREPLREKGYTKPTQHNLLPKIHSGTSLLRTKKA